MEIEFGAIGNISPGQHYSDRMTMREAGVHRKHGAGMDWDKNEGTAAIVLSGGYKDDEDRNDVIIYTGQGGLDRATNEIVADQDWDYAGNRGLIISETQNKPVRVFRGSGHSSPWSPDSGYSYAGLYTVETHFEGSSNGFRICRFKLVRIEDHDVSIAIPESNDDRDETRRSKVVSYRIIRDTKKAKTIKELYNHTCQICNKRIEINGVGYSEGAHIKPLGQPHYGKDSKDNLLCLCPNHHVIFDRGGIYINDDLSLSDGSGNLTVDPNHTIEFENFQYHREQICLVRL